MTDDLVTRLREEAECYKGKTQSCLTDAADRIEQLEADNERLLANIKTDNMWFRTYHKWCEMNGCAPSSSDLSAARAALEASDD